MNYLLLICRDERIPIGEAERARILPATERWVEEMDGRGVRLQGNALEPPATAKSVRLRDGQLVVSDGPFAETKEHVAGFDLVDCADLDEALVVASKHPMAEFGTIEVRRLWSP